MNKYLYFVCLVFALWFTASCRMNVVRGEGEKGTSAPAVQAFNAIDMALPLKANITVQSGTQPGIQIAGYENIIKHIQAKVENNTLRLKTDLDENWTIDGKDITVTITLPVITALSLESTADADIHGNVSGSDFKLSISGGSKVAIDNMNADNFSSDISGAGQLDVKGGAVKHASYEISGAGNIRAFPLQATETTASISGAGKGEVTALTQLTASISGAGAIRYKGHPAVTKEVSGAGSVADAN